MNRFESENMVERSKTGPTALFIVGGLGLGNSTRCAAIIAILKQWGWRVDVASSANGHRFFSESRDIHELFELRVGEYVGAKEKIGLWNVILASVQFVLAGWRNFIILHRVMAWRRPDIVVIDSNYNLAVTLFRGLPVVSLNNSYQVVTEFWQNRLRLPACWAQLFVEVADRLYQKCIPHFVFAAWPAAASDEVRLKDLQMMRMMQIDPIVRKQFYRDTGSREPRGIERILVMYSGAQIGPCIHENLALRPYRIDVLGAKYDNAGHDRIHFVPRTFDSSAWIKACDLVICSGGFSAISEALALGKPLIVVPIPGHAEQNINALRVEQLGVGRRSTLAELENVLADVVRDYQSYRLAYQRLDFAFDGAGQAAKGLAEVLSRARKWADESISECILQ